MAAAPPPPPPPPPRRGNDTNVRGEWEKLLRMRRVRDGDVAADAMSLQEKRCVAQLKAHSWRTAATMVASAVLLVAAGVFAWGSLEHSEMRQNAAPASHSHAGNALSRELETLRLDLLRRLEAIDRKLDTLSPRQARPAAGSSGRP